MTRETLTFATHDEAIAEALRGAPAGDIVSIHQEGCAGQEKPYPPYDVVGCTCAPMILRVGAEA